MKDWIETKNQLPEVGQTVLCFGLFGFDHNKSYGAGYITYKDEFDVYWTGGSRSLYNVSHWYPIAFPKED